MEIDIADIISVKSCSVDMFSLRFSVSKFLSNFFFRARNVFHKEVFA